MYGGNDGQTPRDTKKMPIGLHEHSTRMMQKGHLAETDSPVNPTNGNLVPDL